MRCNKPRARNGRTPVGVLKVGHCDAQPIMAVPAYAAVRAFEPFLPLGFGIAAGAMIWMVFAELIPDANKGAASSTVGIAVTLAFAAMIAFQYLILR